MDNILNVFEKRFNSLDWIINVKKVENMLKIKTKEGLEYICKADHKGNETSIILKDIALNFCYENKFPNSMIKDDFYNSFIVVGTEVEILLNEIYWKAFNKGLDDLKKRNQVFNINSILDTDSYNKFHKDNEIISLIECMWNKGYEFSSKIPYPEIVEKQYNELREKVGEITDVEKLKDFIDKNKDIHTYLDEKIISKSIDDLSNYREINYSYGNIVAKSYINYMEEGKLILNKRIMVFDTEGINEFAKCDIEEYKNIYQDTKLKEMFKNIDISKSINKREKLMKLIAISGQEADFDICDNTYDFEVAFIMDNQEPKDNYAKYLKHLAENLDLINAKNNAGNVVVDLAGYVEKNIKVYEELFEDTDIENNIYRTINMISGNASESVYKQVLEYLGENTIEEEKEENEQE